MPAAVTLENRILILAPTGNDARLSADFLAKANFSPHICRDLSDLCQQLRQGCGTILLAEETLGESSIMELVEELSHQPPWSDVPLVVICSGGEASQIQVRRLGLFGSAGNVSLLERPFRPGTLISALQAALHARKRQYEVRTLLTAVSKSEENLRQLAAIVEFSEDAIVSKDLNSIIKSWNRGATRLFGYTAEEIVGRSVTILMSPDCWAEEAKILERIRRGEHLEHYETVRQHKDGSRIEVSLTLSPIKDGDGQITGTSMIIRDITGQKQAKRDLERAHKELLAASGAKDDFIAALSHELRTPLNPVLLLASEAAEDPELPATVRDQFNQIRNNVELEARLIDDLLDITRISRGKLSLHMNAVDVHAVLKESLTTIGAEIGEKQIVMKLNLAAEHHVVRGDAVRLQQVFWNVLKNAAKFTPAFGKIEVQTRNEDNGDFTVMITDTGIGMNEVELARIFEAFAQGEHARTSSGHRFGGLGLGLAICRMLVESHAGAIRATSRGQNQGSTFYVTLPTIKKEIPETQPQKNGAGTEAIGNGAIASLRILLVEDHEPTRKALGQLLTRRQHEVKLAASAAEARELFSQNNFQLLISDIGLPDGNGFELMKEFRSRNRNLWGIALTGYGMEQDMARSEEAGFISHLTKPIRVQSLDLILATLNDN